MLLHLDLLPTKCKTILCHVAYIYESKVKVLCCTDGNAACTSACNFLVSSVNNLAWYVASRYRASALRLRSRYREFVHFKASLGNLFI